jgi:ribosomal protein S12 methylthiotransferase
MGRKVGLVSLGCPKNLVDSEVMLGLAARAGHVLTADPGQADVIIVNTCAFIDSAKRESVDAILEMARYKRQGACRRLIVTGCLAERYREELRRLIPEVDAVLGTGEVPDIVSAVDGAEGTNGRGAAPLTFHRGNPADRLREGCGGVSHAESRGPSSVDLRRSPVDHRPSTIDHRPSTTNHRPSTTPPTWLYSADTPRVLATPGHYAYLKLAEGCDYKCAFCIIPALRGAYRSRSHESVLKEARALADRGVKELLLVSQDTSYYGVDRGERGGLARLLRDLDKVDGLRWIRLLYLYPTTIQDDLLAAIGDAERVCKYIDLPLQHAADAVLKRMKRPGTRRGYERLLERIRARLPGVALRTTFIVGFPGETDEDVEQLLGFVQDIRFDHLGVFTYSHEEGTSAYRLRDDVPPREKRQRRQRVMSAQRRIVREANRRRVGDLVEVLVDGASPAHELVVQGRLEGQAPEIDPVVYLDRAGPADFRPGDFVAASVTGARDYDLVAVPVVAG